MSETLVWSHDLDILLIVTFSKICFPGVQYLKVSVLWGGEQCKSSCPSSLSWEAKSHSLGQEALPSLSHGGDKVMAGVSPSTWLRADVPWTE